MVQAKVGPEETGHRIAPQMWDGGVRILLRWAVSEEGRTLWDLQICGYYLQNWAA